MLSDDTDSMANAVKEILSTNGSLALIRQQLRIQVENVLQKDFVGEASIHADNRKLVRQNEYGKLLRSE